MNLGRLSGAASMLSGVSGALAPDRVASALELSALSDRGITETRAGLGGTYAALGGWALLSRDPAAHAAVGVTWLGAAAVRVASLVVDRPRTDWTFRALSRPRSASGRPRSSPPTAFVLRRRRGPARCRTPGGNRNTTIAVPGVHAYRERMEELPDLPVDGPHWRGINHLALITDDMDATVRFYHGVLGAAIGGRPRHRIVPALLLRVRRRKHGGLFRICRGARRVVCEAGRGPGSAGGAVRSPVVQPAR